MDHRHRKGSGSSINSNTSRVRSIRNRTACVQSSSGPKRSILLKVAVPFAVISTAVLLGDFHSAYAATFHMSTILPNPIQPLLDLYSTIHTFFTTLPDNIGSLSVTCMSGLYKLTSSLILKTPTWIFDNQWFKDTTLIFSSAAIGLTSSLTALEGVRRMFSGLKPKFKKGRKTEALFKWVEHEPMELKEIIKRWAIASFGMLSVPWLFQKAFKGLNWLSDQLIGMNATVMDSVKTMQHLDWFNVLTMGVFDILLIATLIPTLWKNGRRFFDLLMLGLISPLAMTAWIFDSHRAKFDQWWSNLRELSLVQLYHALFLLVIGWFIYGIPTPADPIGMIIKLLVVIGGFARMVEPPKIVSSHLNPTNLDYEDPKEVASKIAGTIENGINNTVAIAKGPVGIAERLAGKKFISIPLKRRVRVWKRERTFIPPLMRAPKPKKESKPKPTTRRKR